MVLLNCLLSGGSAFAQERTILGKVIAPDGGGLLGVTIQEKGAQNFTTTDAGGNYALTLKSQSPVLVFSFIGYTTQEVAVGKDNRINISLVPTNAQLNEVIVTALGIKKEVKKIGYAVQELKGEEITKARDVNPVQGLEGKIAGLSVGANAEMLTRPQVVMRGNTDILFVVDGVPINSDTWNISPDDVESYSVLKGPNAAALYGFRGQNGAIVITTKRGSKDKKGWEINVNNSAMVEDTWLTVPKSQTEYGRGTNYLYQYAQKGSYTYAPHGTNGNGTYGGVDVLYDNSQRLQEYGPRFEGQLIKQYDGPYDPTTGVRTPTPWTARGANNFDKFMEIGLLNTVNVSAATSGTNSDIRMSYSHTFQKGRNPNTRLNVDNFNLNAGYNFTPRLRLEGNANINVQYSPNIPDASYGPNSYTYMFRVYGSSDYDINDLKNIYKGPQGVPDLTQYAPEYGRENSAWFMAERWMRTHNKLDIYSYLKLSYKLTNDINLAIRSQVTTWDQLRTEQVPSSANLNTYLSWYYFGWYGDYREDHRNLLENNTDFLATYNKKVSDWTIGANVGASSRAFSYKSSWATTKGLSQPGIYILSNTQNGATFTWDSKMQVYSGYYSVDIGYKNFFTLSTTGRVDNLSTLPSGSNTFFYPSVSASTVLSDYIDMPSAISFLKVRASFADVKGALTSSSIGTAYSLATNGYVGPQTLGNYLGYGTEDVTSYDGPTYYNQNGYSITSYYNGGTSVNYSTNLADPALKPYDVQSTEGGLDIRFLKNRLGLDATYFRTVNGPNIFQNTLPSSTGYYSENANGLTTLKTGWELTLSGSPFRNPHGFSWDILANWSTFRETLKSIYGGLSTISLNGHNYKVGERLDAYYSTKFVRDGSGNIVYGTGTNAPLVAPGQSDLSNRGLIGYLNPDFAFGINNRFSYKNFSISFQFDGRIGGKIYDRVLYQGNNGGTSIESASGAYGAARRAEWNSTNQGQNAPVAAYVAPGVVIASGTPHYTNDQIDNLKSLTFANNTTATTVQTYLSSGLGSNVDEYYFIDRSFVKLREVNLTYNFRLKPGSTLKGLSVSLIGRNLLYFAKRKDFDIDQYPAGYNNSNFSANGTYPDLQSATSRRFGANLNVSF
ncbi:SusC/RagA family TonB-linked outer membrane protein [Puia dinghuensis]|uniref:SusC/RagA family TonB-linked outer membrane protein n=2 Tax=Puia dinghuensis TaxID=1792502 RepID=A0A8J2UEM3_9BACT|nr:SusC/RagA family TonB-linked outer membrane protein [Puia dinghuensis]